MAEIELTFQLGHGASAYMIYDDSTMRLVRIGARNQTDKTIRIVSEKWSYELAPNSERHVEVPPNRRERWNWEQWIDSDSGELRQTPGGFTYCWTLGN